MTTDQQRLSAIQAELLPCPFCGSDNLKSVMETSSASFEILCEQCATTGPACRNEVEAGKFWNTRAQLSTPKPEALSREGGEFDEAGERARCREWHRTAFSLSSTDAWLARAQIAHTELTQARKRIAELEAANEKLRRCLLPAYLAMAEYELIDEPMPDNAVMLSFMGSGASDQVTAGEIRAALAFTAPIAEEKADG